MARPEVTKIKNLKYIFCRDPLQYFILKVWQHLDKDCAQHYLQVWGQTWSAHLTLTWPGDLTFWLGKSNFAHKVYSWFVRRYPKFGAAARPFLRYSQRTGGGGILCPLQCACWITFFLFIFELILFIWFITAGNMHFHLSHCVQVQVFNYSTL